MSLPPLPFQPVCPAGAGGASGGPAAVPVRAVGGCAGLHGGGPGAAHRGCRPRGGHGQHPGWVACTPGSTAHCRGLPLGRSAGAGWGAGLHHRAALLARSPPPLLSVERLLTWSYMKPCCCPLLLRQLLLSGCPCRVSGLQAPTCGPCASDGRSGLAAACWSRALPALRVLMRWPSRQRRRGMTASNHTSLSEHACKAGRVLTPLHLAWITHAEALTILYQHAWLKQFCNYRQLDELVSGGTLQRTTWQRCCRQQAQRGRPAASGSSPDCTSFVRPVHQIVRCFFASCPRPGSLSADKRRAVSSLAALLLVAAPSGGKQRSGEPPCAAPRDASRIAQMLVERRGPAAFGEQERCSRACGLSWLNGMRLGCLSLLLEALPLLPPESYTLAPTALHQISSTMAVAKLEGSMEICLEGGSLLAGGTSVLEKVAPGASVRPEDSGAGAVLGFTTAAGCPTARADIDLGKVGAAHKVLNK